MFRNPILLQKKIARYKKVFSFNKKPDTWPKNLRLRKEMEDRTLIYLKAIAERSSRINGTDVSLPSDMRDSYNSMTNHKVRKPKMFKGRKLPPGYGG